MKNCCLLGKCQHSSLQKINLKRLLLFYILCEEFRSYIGLHKFPGKKFLCVYLLENKTIVFLCNSSYNRCENKYTWLWYDYTNEHGCISNVRYCYYNQMISYCPLIMISPSSTKKSNITLYICNDIDVEIFPSDSLQQITFLSHWLHFIFKNYEISSVIIF